MPRITVNGNCFACGETASRTAMKNHLLKDHNSGSKYCSLILFGFSTPCHLRAKRSKTSVSNSPRCQSFQNAKSIIEAECARNKGFWLLFCISKDSRLSDTDRYLRDIWFGCCGHMSQFIIDRHNVNDNPKKSAFATGDIMPYEYIDSWEGEMVCESCAGGADDLDDTGLIEITNSPRIGVCGYTGDNDRWIYYQIKQS